MTNKIRHTIYWASFVFALPIVQPIKAQQKDTVLVTVPVRKEAHTVPSASSYTAFTCNTKNGPASGIVFLHSYSSTTDYKGQPAVSIEQRWIADTVFYHSITLVSAKNGAALYSNEWWPHKQYRQKNKNGDWIVHQPLLADSTRHVDFKKMEQLFKDYSSNWFNDLYLFPYLNYQPGRTFKVVQKIPATEHPAIQYFTVIDSSSLKADNGQDISCWLVEYKPSRNKSNYHKYWVQQSSGIIWKQEDYLDGIFRYRVKSTIHP